MTAPPMYSGSYADPLTQTNSPRQFAGRRRMQGAPGQTGDTSLSMNDRQFSGSNQEQAPQPTGEVQPPPQKQWQTSRPPAPQNSQGQQPRPTFAQMQAQGIARPAPQQIQQQSLSDRITQQLPPQQQFSPYASSPNGALSGAVTQALNNPSAYGAPQVQQTFDMLNQRLGQDYGYQRKQLNDEMATRGLSESTIAGQRYSDLATEQARAEANMATQLASQAAQQYGTDRTAAINSGIGYGNLDLSRELGLGGLGIQAGALTGNYGGQETLSSRLGLGNLGISEGALTGQYGGNDTLESQKLAQQFALDIGGMTGQYGGQDTFAAKQAGQQNALQAGALTGRYFAPGATGSQGDAQFEGDGSGTVAPYAGVDTLGAQQLAQSGSQFQSQLAQALKLGTMGDVTANRGIAAQENLNAYQAQIDLIKMLSQFGIAMNPVVKTGSDNNNSNVDPITGKPRTDPTGKKTVIPWDGGGIGDAQFGDAAPQGDDQSMASTQSLQQLIQRYLNGNTAPKTSTGPSTQIQTQQSPSWRNNFALPGQTQQQTFQRNTNYNPQTGAGPLAMGVSQQGQDPMSLYARGLIDYPTLQKMTAGVNANAGSYGFSPGAMSNYSDSQLQQALRGQYQSLLSANRGVLSGAQFLQTLQAQGADPRALSMAKTLFGG